jgi:ATP-binding protein involved in chromosome partitioning
MSWLDLPDGSRMELFGAGGGQAVADSLTSLTGSKVGLLGQVPIEVAIREGGDDGTPIVLSQPDSASSQAFGAIADTLAGRQRSLVGRPLGLSVAAR